VLLAFFEMKPGYGDDRTSFSMRMDRFRDTL
jgi:hypothetical protein